MGRSAAKLGRFGLLPHVGLQQPASGAFHSFGRHRLGCLGLNTTVKMRTEVGVPGGLGGRVELELDARGPGDRGLRARRRVVWPIAKYPMKEVSAREQLPLGAWFCNCGKRSSPGLFSGVSHSSARRARSLQSQEWAAEQGTRCPVKARGTDERTRGGTDFSKVFLGARRRLSTEMARWSLPAIAEVTVPSKRRR